MPYYDIYSTKPSKIDEFSIYERKLPIEEIEQHNYYCILPPKLYGWDLSHSTPSHSTTRKYMFENDIAGRVDGAMKSFREVSTGKRMFEVMVSTPPPTVIGPVNPAPKMLTVMDEGYTSFGVGISDDNATETSVLYNVAGNELPCLENHIILWVIKNDTTNDIFLELSYALDGEYNTTPIIVDTTMIDPTFSYNTFSIALDSDAKNILFFCKGELVCEFDFSFVASNMSFKPTFTAMNKPYISALINSFGDFEYSIEGYDAWGEGVRVNDNDESINFKKHSSLILDDNPIVYFPCNERYGVKSFDIQNGLVLNHTTSDIVASYGLADGYSLSYRQNRYFETRRHSTSVIPSNLLNTVEGAIEFNFTRQAFELYGGFNIFTLKNETYVGNRGSDVPDNGWVMSLSGSIADKSMTNIPDYVMEFDLYYAAKNENIDVSYGVGSAGKFRIEFDTPLHPDGMYNMIFSFDEKKRLWVYINGEIVARICGAAWCASPDDFVMGIATDLGFGSDYTPNTELLFDNIALYDKHLTHNDAKERHFSVSKSFNEKKDNDLYFLHAPKQFSTTDSEMFFLPDADTYKQLSYSVEDMQWHMNYHANTKPISMVSSSRSHTVFLHTDGTVSAVGNNDNAQCVVNGFVNIIKVCALSGFTMVLDGDGGIGISNGVSDPWGIKQIPTINEPVVDIACGMNHVLALTVTGKIISWGRNDDGQATTPNDISTIVQISAGDSSSYALDTSGYLWAWGSDYFGETSIPEMQTERLICIASDGYIAAAVTASNTLQVYGDIQLQNISTVPDAIITTVDVGKSSLLIGLGHDTYVADGTLQFSFDTSTSIGDFIDPKFAYAMTREESVYVESVTSGYQFAIALRSDKKLFGWGNNSYSYGYPLNFPSNIISPEKIVAYYHVLLLESDGTVKSWGRNNYGQTNVPSGLNDVKDVYVFDYTSVAIKSNGDLVTWGQAVTWLPASINPDFKKVHINPYDQVMLVLMNDGTMVEYSTDALSSEFNGLSNIIDFATTEYFSGYNYENFGVALTREGKLLYLNDYNYNNDIDGFVQYPIYNHHTVKMTGGEDIGLIDRKGVAYVWDQYDNFVREERTAINLSTNVIESNNVFAIDASSKMDIWYITSYVENPPNITFVPDLTFTPDGVSWDFLVDTERGYNNGQTSVDLMLGGTDLLIDWGDGTEPTNSPSHVYGIPGIYPIKVTGTVTYMHYNAWITEIRQWGSGTTFKDMRFCVGTMLLENGSITATDSPRFEGNISFDSVFSNKNFGTLNVSHWDTSLVTKLSGAFQSSNFNEDISRWNVSSVVTLYAAFRSNAVFNQDISGWDVLNVTTLERAFQNTVAFNQDISVWDVSNVIDMSYTFYGSDLFLQDLSSWSVSQVTDYYGFSIAALINQYPQFLPNFT